MAELPLIPEDARNVTEEVIRNVANGIVLTGAIVAPNLLKLLSKSLSPRSSAKTLRAIRHAKSRGWLTFRDTPKGVEVALTESGKLQWQKIELNRPLHQKKWDKKWRLVLFDIPVSKKENADVFRLHIKRLGLKQLQHSVWVTPYPCQTQIALIRQIYEIKPYVRLVEAHSIDDEVSLLELFKL